VDKVAPDSAWAAAGLRPGDAIRGLNGAPFGIIDELIYQLRAAPGASHRLHIHRGNSSGIVEVDGGNLDDIQFRLQTSPAS
jgi:C-terminal processing protease CtpA/Prc